MVKYLLNFLFIFLTLSSFSFANYTVVNLKQEFGQDLTKAPFFLRFSFNNRFNKDWAQSNYSERKAFLMDYETNLANEQVREKDEARAEARAEKKRLLIKKAAEREENNKLKERAEEEKAQEEADAQRQKELDRSVAEQQQELTQMERQATQGN